MFICVWIDDYLCVSGGVPGPEVINGKQKKVINEDREETRDETWQRKGESENERY